MERVDDRSDHARTGVRVVTGWTLCALFLVGDPSLPALAVPLILATPAGTAGDELLPLLLWLAGGAIVGGLVGWGGAIVLGSITTAVGLGFGFAVGGGIGTVLKLLVVDGESEPPESVAVSMETDRSTPEPQPADLFEAHPDPLVYYEDRGEGPVVRAVNDAYVDRFGVAATAVEDAALGDALMVTSGAADVVDAAAGGRTFDATLACETGDGTVQLRTRVVAVSDDAGTRGYVLYSPTSNET